MALQALLLDYRDDRLLLLKAQAALQVYPPEWTRFVMDLFGEEPEFRQALRAHGEYLMPPVMHFYQNPVGSIEMMNRVAGTGKVLTPEQRAWYAVNFANKEGQDFTGQFVVGGADGNNIEWIWTERITEGITQFFTSGIRTLESRYRTDQPIRMEDVGWAAVDALIIGSAVKFLKAGRAAAGTARARVSPPVPRPILPASRGPGEWLRSWLATQSGPLRWLWSMSLSNTPPPY